MATVASALPGQAGDETFFRRIAYVMGAVLVAGFLIQYLAGRSTFAARPLVHMHGVAFMGWVALFVTQARLATIGPIALHRRLGWIGAGWAVLLVVLGFAITLDVVMRGTTPFFFRPQHFLIANPLSVLCFAALTFAAIRLRRATDWHQRLHICGMAAIIGPGVGRILPMPLLIPWSYQIAVLTGLMFPLAGAIRDWRREGIVHPAWWWGIAASLSVLLLAHVIADSPAGDALYRAVTTGQPGANVPGLAFAPPPSAAQ